MFSSDPCFRKEGKPNVATKYSLELVSIRWKALDKIYQIYMRPLGETFVLTSLYIPLHLLNPIWKPRKALLQSVIRAKNVAPAKKQSGRSDAARPAPFDSNGETTKSASEKHHRGSEAWTEEPAPLRPQKFSKCLSRIFVSSRSEKMRKRT